jgi:hypothetical protein
MLALVAAGVAWESLRKHELSAWWMVLPLILFVFIAVYHARTLRARESLKMERCTSITSC